MRVALDELPAAKVWDLCIAGLIGRGTRSVVIEAGGSLLTVAVEETPMNNGGVHWHFRCPGCRRRAKVLRLLGEPLFIGVSSTFAPSPLTPMMGEPTPKRTVTRAKTSTSRMLDCKTPIRERRLENTAGQAHWIEEGARGYCPQDRRDPALHLD